MGKVRDKVKNVPTAVWVCATILLSFEILGVAVNVETGRDIAPLVSWLTTFNAAIVTGGTILFRLETGNKQTDRVEDKVDTILNGGMDAKLRTAMEDHLPEVVGAILDARGLTVGQSSHDPDTTKPHASDSRNPTHPTQPTA